MVKGKKTTKKTKNTLPTISLCMIVKDEEAFLEQCLNSVKALVDEMIIIDTGSTDKTKAIAQQFTKKVLDFPWGDDFAAVRNEAIKHATKDWILIMDADEVIAQQDHEKIKQTIQQANKNKVTAFSLAIRNYANKSFTGARKQTWIPLQENDSYSEQAKNFKGYHQDAQIRLFKNYQEYAYAYRVYEDLTLSLASKKANIKETNITIHHYGFTEPANKHQKHKDYFLKLLKKQVIATPTHPKPVFLLATHYFDNGIDEVEGIEKATEKQKEYDQKAIILFERLAKVYKKFEKMYPYLGKLYMRNKRPQDAERVFLYSIKIAPKFKESYLHLSSFYYNQGQKELALKVLMKATTQHLLDADMCVSLGFLLVQNKRPEEAVKILEQGLQRYGQTARPDLIESMKMNLADAKAAVATK